MFTFTALSFGLNAFMPTIPVIYWYFVSINIFTFFLFVIDKFNSIKDRKRVPEISLHFFSIAGGFIGAILAILLARHKINKKAFLFIQSLIIAIWLIVIYLVSTNLQTIQRALS
jgi:uncharacterized membrane protein YsdA (DUF1294 family)